tara:strand:- start:4980 stop:5624 length:645 start_codon:yes stop_codon:yes gene_type:complete
MKSIKIYTLADPYTLEIRYVGITSKSLKERLSNHWSHISQNNHRVNWIKSLRSKGNKKPIIELIDEVNELDWKCSEVYWISQFKSWGFRLVNSSLGGEGAFGYKHLNPYWKGRKRSLEQCAKMSQYMKEAIADGTRVNPNPKGNKRDVNVIEKSSSKHKKPIDQLTKYGELIKEFESVSEASLELELLRTAIGNCLKGRSKSCGGYKWRYKTKI